MYLALRPRVIAPNIGGLDQPVDSGRNPALRHRDAPTGIGRLNESENPGQDSKRGVRGRENPDDIDFPIRIWNMSSVFSDYGNANSAIGREFAHSEFGKTFCEPADCGAMFGR